MSFDGLDRLSAEGLSLLDESDPVRAHTSFLAWVSDVREWIASRFPDSGLTAEWMSQSNSNLLMGGGYYDDPNSWMLFRMAVQSRMRWLGALPGTVAIRNLAAPARAQNDSALVGRKEIKLNTVARAYVDPARINALKNLKRARFDVSRLVRLCEELNVCFAGECYLSMIMLTRGIIDHVPPVFGCKNFNELANNFAGAKSFKDAMSRLDASSRKIADYYLHTQIRTSESLPTVTQIDFSNDIDFLLSEITRLLNEP